MGAFNWGKLQFKMGEIGWRRVKNQVEIFLGLIPKYIKITIFMHGCPEAIFLVMCE